MAFEAPFVPPVCPKFVKAGKTGDGLGLQCCSKQEKKKGLRLVATTLDVLLVPRAGIEPARRLPLPPQDSVSTNSTTSAQVE